MSNKKARYISSIFAFSVSVVLVVVAGLLYLNRQLVIDQITVWQYEPTAAMTEVVKKSGLTSRGKFTLYATQPSIEPAEAFNQKCPRQEAGSPILGCYTPSDRVYIFDITNEQLDGMEEVTAVHEMLHAAWRRLGAGDRQKLTISLKKAYETHKTPELEKRMAYYERSEPDEIVNELHSILGTEIPSLGGDLEFYYNNLFDRQNVLSLHNSYSSVYNELYSRADNLRKQIETKGADIESRSAAYVSLLASYTADVNAFNARARIDSFATRQQFNSERGALLQRSANLEATRVAINEDITAYNRLNDEYRDVAAQIDGLNESVDSIKQLDKVPSA